MTFLFVKWGEEPNFQSSGRTLVRPICRHFLVRSLDIRLGDTLNISMCTPSFPIAFSTSIILVASRKLFSNAY